MKSNWTLNINIYLLFVFVSSSLSLFLSSSFSSSCENRFDIVPWVNKRWRRTQAQVPRKKKNFCLTLLSLFDHFLINPLINVREKFKYENLFKSRRWRRWWRRRRRRPWRWLRSRFFFYFVLSIKFRDVSDGLKRYIHYSNLYL